MTHASKLFSCTCVALLLWAAMFISSASPAADPVVPESAPESFVEADLSADCGAPPAGADNKGKRDYRVRNSTDDWAKDFAAFQKFHVERAAKNMAPGGDKGDIAPNFMFVLRRSPNHLPTLDLMSKWSLAGGRDAQFPSPKCFFVWASEFAPDDVAVWQRGGYYFWKGGDIDRAEKWWQQAVRVDPASADSHYNLGLLYAKRKDYAKAREHARVAYDAGYPLPGLRRQLERAGQWRSAGGEAEQ
jgi:tetratricopeptide (TPR) repeat protein